MFSFFFSPQLLALWPWTQRLWYTVINLQTEHVQTNPTLPNQLAVLPPHLKEPHEVVNGLCLGHDVKRDGVAHRAFHAHLPQPDMVGTHVVCTDQAGTTRQMQRTSNACLEISTHTGPKRYFRPQIGVSSGVDPEDQSS